ncbi:MAG: tRNA (adenosine(37)-N6)-threonylcarbamoyltransferase complex ATPase subunit type 1 TsaE [bacterium]|nr:tRNA (adenosine(37)-N6)-threonylcarbamoyltransferase complex ATPase subunit type 1 TsaE [bacterium]
MEKVVQTLAELEDGAERFVGALAPSPRGATLVTLSGELGAGKTAFVKAAAKALGVEEIVTSPTFVLEKIYLLPPKQGSQTSLFRRLIHIDAYRLEGATDLAALGFDELMQDSGNLILLEWPEKVIEELPEPKARIMFTMLSDGSRAISYG